jgi:hypothetical protein
MSPNLLTRERVLYSGRTLEQTKRLKYMKLPALLALRKYDPKKSQSMCQKIWRHFCYESKSDVSHFGRENSSCS